jgi:hypothetical protein
MSSNLKNKFEELAKVPTRFLPLMILSLSKDGCVDCWFVGGGVATA